MSNSSQKAYVESLAAKNRVFYSTPDGRAMLRSVDLTFEHRWIYLFELVQNSLDAGARSISISLTQNNEVLVFQHDGSLALEEKHVEGLSKIFRSTKGAASVGFMGVGFKSVFSRFLEARISGWGWSFRYEMARVVGQTYGDVQLELLGVVLPIWDDGIFPPEKGFTTRIELRKKISAEADLELDLAKLLEETDRTLLAILAAAGLERLTVCGRSWKLSVVEGPDGSLRATANSAEEGLLWQIFLVSFSPSRAAVARFLEHRRIIPTDDERERIYAEAARKRKVLGVLPLDEFGIAAPPKRGRVYATLPTEITVPFGIHINADWLLNVSRTGLRQIEENDWQQEIVNCIADIVGCLLRWARSACTDPRAAKKAFAALAMPMAEQGRLEALLAEDCWMARLRANVEGEAVLPVWSGRPPALNFGTAEQTAIPPAVLSKVLETEPAFLSDKLLAAPVLAREVLGAGASELLSRAGLLREMLPDDLANAWSAGLEEWWNTLEADSSVRRDLLFRLWGAVAELVSDDAWQSAELNCVRTAGAQWLSIDRALFFGEALPSENEPGGAETREFLEVYIPNADACAPDTWFPTLRQAAAKETGWGPFSKAMNWVERGSTRYDLRVALKAAIEAMTNSSKQDWSVLVPLGHWVMHRKTRADLLTHVLVDSPNGMSCVPTTEALLADPYVERGEGRRRLFKEMCPISAKYLERSLSEADAHEWRGLFERAGAHGTLGVRPVTSYVSRYEREHVARFLGCQVSDVNEANHRGYELRDFVIAPALPNLDAPETIRGSLAEWLEDGFSALKGKGRRQVDYYFRGSYSMVGRRSAAWVKTLSDLQWVPCNDGFLRRPGDVLPRFDSARDDAPFAELSRELLSSLEKEGIAFGSAIPNAPALRRLVTSSAQLDATDLAVLLCEAREGIESDEDAAHFAQALARLSVPTSDGRRVPLRRIVRKVGGRLRGALGGWICSLGDLDVALQTELSRNDFPHKIPDTTTGEQALDYIQEVWSRACSSPDGLANEVRDILPIAYSYCLDDQSLSKTLEKRWIECVSKACVFVDREWVTLAKAGQRIYFDDLEDHRFIPSHIDLRIATSGHLGNTLDQQRSTALALGLPALSSVIIMKWHIAGPGEIRDWGPRFELISELLNKARGSARAQVKQDAITVASTVLRIQRVAELRLMISVENGPEQDVPVNARLHGDLLSVLGRPTRFASDAAKELLRGYGLRQRGDLAADLTGMLCAVDDEVDFSVAVNKFARSFAPGADRLCPTQIDPDSVAQPSGKVKLSKDTGTIEQRIETEWKAPDVGEATGPGVGSGVFDWRRAMAQQRVLAEKLKKALKGELHTVGLEDDAGEPEQQTGAAESELGDEIYRAIAKEYERLSGRDAVLGEPGQIGWDIISSDSKTGSERLIEVKGKGVPWVDDEVVELSRAQAHRALQTIDKDDKREWYLYVVERTNDEFYQVLPIKNPVRIASKWILCGDPWRLLAENPREVELPGGTDA